MPNFVYIRAPLAFLYTFLPLYIHPFDLPFVPSPLELSYLMFLDD